MDPDPPLTLLDVFRVVQQWARGNGVQVTELILVQRNGKQLPFEVPTNPIASAEEAPSEQAEKGKSPKFSRRHGRGKVSRRIFAGKMLKKLLSILPEAGQDPMLRKVVYRLSGYKYRSSVYSALLFLIGKGRV